jgi:lipopolysaccharide transport system permease protein
MESILGRAGIVATVNVPRIVYPISASLTASYMMLVEFTVFFGFLVAFQYLPPLTILFLPIIVLLVYFLSLGLGIAFSVINVRYRDIRSIWTIVLQASFFLTPIFYKLDFLPDIIRQFIQFSPLAQLVEMSHQVVLENKLPDPFWFTYSVLSTASIFGISLFLYKKFNKNLVEHI